MKKTVTYFLMFCFALSSVLAQVDQGDNRLPSTIFSPEVLVGDWLAPDGSKFSIEKDDQDKLKLKKKKTSDWIPLIRSGHNRFVARLNDKTLYQIKVLNKDELEITDSNVTGASELWTRKDAEPVPNESDQQRKSEKYSDAKRFFMSYYPSLGSPFALYAGLLNRKVNVYFGLSVSTAQFHGDFQEGTSKGKVYQETLGNRGSEGIALSDEITSQATVAVGLSSEIKENRLRVHYGVGFGKYELNRGFDIWNRNADDEWIYEKSVWAKDESSVVEGVYVETGLLWDIGPLISIGFGTIQFERNDLRVGIGYVF